MSKTEEELQAEAKKAEETAAAEKVAAEKKHTEWFKNLPEDAQKEISKLRTENASHRTSRKDVDSELEDLRKKNEEYEAERVKAAEEQGKFKELHEASRKELEAMKPVKARIKELETHLKAELALELKTLSAEMVDVVKSANVSIEKQIDMARKLKGVNGSTQNSPAAERGGHQSVANDKLLEDIRSEKDKTKKAKMLMDLKEKSPELYAKYRGGG